MKQSLKLSVFSMLASFGVSAYANPFMQLNSGIVQASTNQVMSLHFQPEGYVSGDNATLKITMDGEHQICLYPTYSSGVCSGEPKCSTVSDSWETGKQIVEGTPFTLGFTVSGLNALANETQNPSEYKCMEVKLAYSNYGGGAPLVTADAEADYICQINGDFSTFYSGNDASNPCRLNPTQMLIKQPTA